MQHLPGVTVEQVVQKKKVAESGTNVEECPFSTKEGTDCVGHVIRALTEREPFFHGDIHR